MATRNETWNGLREFKVSGRYFEILSAPAAVDVKIYVEDGAGGERLVGSESSIDAGFFHIRAIGNVLLEPFSRIEITNSVSQATKFLFSDGLSGNRSVPADITDDATRILGTLAPAAFTTAKKTVTNASGTLLAANTARKYLFIQNQSATGVIYIKCDGATAVADATGIQLQPGDVYEPAVPPTGLIAAIGSIASNPDVHVIEA